MRASAESAVVQPIGAWRGILPAVASLFASAACTVFDSGGQTLVCGAPAAAPTGYPCLCQSDCSAPNSFCLSELEYGFPYGTCSKSCDAQSCEPGYVCVDGSLCMAPCATAADCPVGRFCATAGASTPYCDPLCQGDVECRSGKCNLYSGKCILPSLILSGGGVGAHCASNSGCKSAACLQGACVSRCNPARQACPDGASCVAVSANDGLCLPPCNSDADCAALRFSQCTAMSGGKFCFLP